MCFNYFCDKIYSIRSRWLTDWLTVIHFFEQEINQKLGRLVLTIIVIVWWLHNCSSMHPRWKWWDKKWNITCYPQVKWKDLTFEEGINPLLGPISPLISLRNLAIIFSSFHVLLVLLPSVVPVDEILDVFWNPIRCRIFLFCCHEDGPCLEC